MKTHTQMGLEFRSARISTPGSDQCPMTQSELVELSGVAREATISRMENGYRCRRSTYGWALGAINRRRSQLGLPAVNIEYLSDAERGARAPAVPPAMSPGELARLYVMERLAASEAAEEAREGLARLEAELTAVRQELALATVAILQHGGKTSKSVAEEFAAKNLGGSQLSS